VFEGEKVNMGNIYVQARSRNETGILQSTESGGYPCEMMGII
jgi:hypothetical protein